MARLLFFASSALLLQAALGFMPGRPLPQVPTKGARFAQLRMAATADEYRACYNVRTWTPGLGVCIFVSGSPCEGVGRPPGGRRHCICMTLRRP